MITPRRAISTSVCLVRERRLPVAGQVLVSLGDRVTYQTPVLKADMKGDLVIIRLPEKLGMEPEDVTQHILVSVGDRVTVGQKIVHKKSFFSYFDIIEKAKVSGVVEFFTDSNGHLGIREDSTLLEVRAFIPGVVSEIIAPRSIKIEATVGLLQGAIGYGGEVTGTVCNIEADCLDEHVLKQLPYFETPCIIVGGTYFTKEFFLGARSRNIVGIVVSSIKSDDVSSILKTSVFGTSPVYSSDHPTILIVEGFGSIPLSQQAKDFFLYAHGKLASLHGLTQVRAGAIRPELIIHEPSQGVSSQELLHTYPKVGDVMRVVRGRHFGKMGRIVSLPEKLFKLESGIETHVAELDILGEIVSVSLANIESM